MSFVASPEQVATFLRRCSEPSYSQDAMVVEFTTTTEFIRSVLPPTLEPADEPTGLISVSTWASNVCGDFELSSVSVRCRADGMDGYWVLHLIVSDSFAITWGRETWGEVKRQGTAGLHSNGIHKYGHAERRGVRLIEMEADFKTSLGPETAEWFDFEVKAFPNSQGTGLERDPQLIALKVVDHNALRATGKGKLTLRGTRTDPLHTIPILSIGDFVHVSGPTDWRVISERPLCPAQDYLPFFVLRHYDDLADMAVGAGLAALQTRSEDTEAPVKARTWTSV